MSLLSLVSHPASSKLLVIDENERFGEFYTRSINTVNACFNFGKKIPENHVDRKILGSLTKEFQTKITKTEGVD